MKQISLKTFLRKYPNNDTCLDEIFKKKYPNGVDCVKCKKITKYFKLKNRYAYSCTWCRTQIFPLVDTAFEKSSVDLRLWFYAMFLMTSTRAGISAKQLERELGVCYKTAHRMMKMIRARMNESDGGGKLTGTVEHDGSYFGGRGVNRAYGWQADRKKDAVIGVLERDGRAIMKHVRDESKEVVIPFIQKYVSTDAILMTDEHPSYKYLNKYGYVNHFSVNHKGKEYVREHVYHTNSVEGLWGRIKPSIKGVYRKVSSKYLENYMDEYCFRYNHRKEPEVMFDLLLDRTIL